ncbi:cysteine protease StiP domain-containing protein, partial [Streptomyces sp. NPDC059506]|uniref:cysteine protease StiP domain-containing protein n=1 Tax=Streptomyces sp. NPDC059506 TaxID=3347751 RepID=UPI0036953348
PRERARVGGAPRGGGPPPPRPPRGPPPPPGGEETGRVLLAVVPSYTPGGQARPVHRPASCDLPEPLRGPEFSSYAADEVGWLLKDLSDVTLEAPTEEREEAIQSGGAHYAESLPVEYQPTAEYRALFRSALDASATRIARAVGTVTETLLAERGPGAGGGAPARGRSPQRGGRRRGAEWGGRAP